jgi:NADPH:quinone reductase-like Zn-dependent oxidoreductase
MQALVVTAHGGKEALRLVERPVPPLRADQVLVRCHAAGMNHLDVWVRRGVESHRFPLPMTIGSDGAGEVFAVGDLVTQWKVGDRVALAPGYSPRQTENGLSGRHNLDHDYGVFGEHRDGTCAEYFAAPEENLLRIPEGVSYEAAGSFGLAALTAHHMLVHRAQVRPGMDVLVHAAGSGVSIMAIQVARLYGARVLVTASSDEKLLRARDLGASVLINYAKEDFLSRVREVTNKRGVDIVVDHVGEATIGQSLKALTRGGAVVTCGATSGPKLEADLRLIFFKSLSLLGSTMGGLGEMHEIWRLLERGQLTPIVAKVLPMSEAAQGHALLESRSIFGKVVLKPGT